MVLCVDSESPRSWRGFHARLDGITSWSSNLLRKWPPSMQPAAQICILRTRSYPWSPSSKSHVGRFALEQLVEHFTQICHADRGLIYISLGSPQTAKDQTKCLAGLPDASVQEKKKGSGREVSDWPGSPTSLEELSSMGRAGVGDPQPSDRSRKCLSSTQGGEHVVKLIKSWNAAK